MKIYRLIGLLLISTTIWGCATAPQQPVRTSIAALPKVDENIETVSSDISRLLADYQKTQHDLALQIALISLAANYQAQANCMYANKVIKYALPILDRSELIAKANILRSECAILSLEGIDSSDIANQLSQNADSLNLLSVWLTQVNVTALDDNWLTRLSFINAYLQSMQGQYETALLGTLEGDTASSIFAPLKAKLTFDWLGRLSFDDRMAIIEMHPRLFRYQRLFNIIEDASISDVQRQQQLLLLVQNTATAGEFSQLPEQVNQFLALDLNKQQQTAVLLPLSGRLAGQGEAIKQGILAGYYQQLMNFSNSDSSVIDSGDGQKNTLVFFDTGSEDELLSTINQESMQAYSSVIGPLLKPHIERMQAMLSSNTLRIHLNTLDANMLTAPSDEDAPFPLVHFFALSPEQEAQELALQMHEQNIQHPILIHDDSAVTKRIADAFLATWKQLRYEASSVAPSEVIYTDNKSMRVGITSALDVLQSQQRIDQMSNLINEDVLSVTRNRRDVDAFVVFARPNELELVNPIIESSMSLFTGQQIPVYATSFSYNHKQNRNSLRDLRSLVFVDMPFVLPSGRQSELAREVDALFNQPSSTYLRLFAFGYDAVTLTQQIIKLRIFNQLSLAGLSGGLSIDRAGNVERKLSTLAIDNGS